MTSINSTPQVVPSLNPIKTKSSDEISSSSTSRRPLWQEFLVTDTDTDKDDNDNSFDVYYRESSARIPFLWESQPGTPKIHSMESPMLLPPPLTPPPSFHKHKNTAIPRKVPTKQKKNNKKTQFLMMSPSRPSYSSASSSFSSEHRISSPRRMSCDIDPRIAEEDHYCESTSTTSSPVSTLCFRAARRSCFS